MFCKKSHTRVLLPFGRVALCFVVAAVFFGLLLSKLTLLPVNAATTSTLNFQARLQTATGAIVPDGYYNVEFKLYNAASSAGSAQGSCTGDSNCLWTETRYDSNGVTAGNDNRVRVKNGYLTVDLGSVTSFSSTINWDQQLWITMRVGGSTQTATPTYDPEMSPRLKLTGVPYAFRAGQLATGNGSLQSTLEILQPTVGNQVFQIADHGAAGTYTLLTDVSGIRLQATTPGSQQIGNFSISGTAIAGTAVITPSIDTPTATSLAIGANTATAISLGQDTTLAAGKSLIITGSAALPGTPTEGQIYYRTDADQLYVYTGAKWQADRSTATKIVAASDSQNKEKADYVAAGSNSDEDAINAAIAALPGAGGVVRLLEGTFNIDGSIVMPSNVAIIGAGPSTVVRLRNGHNAALNLIVNSDTVNGNTRVSLKDFRLDGNMANNTGTQDGAYFEGDNTGYTVSGLWVENFQGSGLQWQTSLFDSVISNNQISNNANGVRMGNGARNVSITGNVFFDNTSFGLWTDDMVDSLVSSNTFHENTEGFLMGQSSGNNVSSNSFYTNANMGMSVYESYGGDFITGNVFTSNGDASGESHLELSFDVTDIAISNNSFTNGTAAVYGIRIADNTTTGSVISGNIFNGTYSNGMVSDAGTSTKYNAQQLGADIAFMTSGSVGIGDITPSYKLDVAGDINTTTTYRIAGVAGATLTCSGGNLLQNAEVQGGIVTGGSCVAAGGGSGVTTVGTFSNTSIANGASISGTTITFGAADTTNPGMVSTGVQTFAGAKTFTDSSTGGSTTTVVTQNASGTQNNGLLVDKQGAGTLTNGILISRTAGTLTNGLQFTGTMTNLIESSSLTISGSGVTTIKNASNDAAAFAVQNSSNSRIFGVDASGSQAFFGQASALAGKLLLYNASNANTVTIQSGATSASYSLTLPTSGPSTSQCLKSGASTASNLEWAACGGAGSTTQTVYLVPEFAGGVLWADGTNNSGTMTSDYDSTNRYTYYSWTSTSATLQDYDIVVRSQIPSDYVSSFGNFKIRVYASSTNSANNNIQVSVRDNSGTVCANNVSVLPGSVTTWVEQSVSLSGCSFAANDRIVVNVKTSALSNNVVRVGEINYQYSN